MVDALTRRSPLGSGRDAARVGFGLPAQTIGACCDRLASLFAGDGTARGSAAPAIPIAGASMPPRTTSADNLIKRVSPDILALLADGVPRRRYAIVAALAHRHPKQDVQRVIARLVVLGRLGQQSGWYTLPAVDDKQG